MLFDIYINDAKILIIDDSKIVQMKIESMLIEQVSNTFHIGFANSAEEGLAKLDAFKPDLIILDIEMPGMSGLDMCRLLKSKTETELIPVIILTSSDNLENKTIALKNGANDFLSKNQDWVDLKLKIESLLKFKYTIFRLERAENLVTLLSNAIGLRDTYAKGHGERVSYYATLMARRLNLARFQVQDITIGGYLHDIGKIGIPDAILNKNSSLTEDEFAIMKQHPTLGYELCMPIHNFDRVRDMIKYHHEKLNGSGYPEGLTDRQISMEAKIIGVADIYDALTSRRSYREALNNEDAFIIMDEMVSKEEISKPLLQLLKSIVSEEGTIK